jgi:type IV pilus assembly protein PilQ
LRAIHRFPESRDASAGKALKAGLWLVTLLWCWSAGVAVAQELSGLRWVDGERAVFAITAPPDATYTTEVLDNGYRLRIAFPGARLARDIRDIGESGIVRGVFPYETDSPNRANFDILLKTEGSIEIFPVAGGLEVTVAERGELPAVVSQPIAPPVDTPSADAAEPRVSEPGPYDGLTELERMVLAEIEDANRAVAETGDGGASGEPAAAATAIDETTPAGSSAPEAAPEAPMTSTLAEAQPAPDSGASQRARIVLPPTTDQATDQATAAERRAGSLSDTDTLQDVMPAEAAAVVESAPAQPPVEQESLRFDIERATPPAVMPEPPMVSRGSQSGADQLVDEEVALARRAAASAQASAPEAAQEPISIQPGTVEFAPRGDDVDAGWTDERRLESIVYSELPGGRLQVNFSLSGGDLDPGIFRTNQPPRIVLDFFETGNGILDTIQRVGFGAVESIVTAETDDRTRGILNLVAPVDYEQRVVGNDVVLVMSSPADTRVATGAVRQRPAFESAAIRDLAFEVADVDFRRTPEGGGMISVTLSSPEIGVDVREEAGEIIIDFPGTDLPPELEKRLDVVDFATPIQTVDTFFTGSGARMIVSPVGEYTYSSYQVGDTLTVQVNPVLVTEDEREPDEFGYVGDELSFNFQRISVRAALQVIADFTGLNFVTSDSVSGDLSLRLQDVPWDQALDTILQVKGLAMRRRGNVVWVAPAEEIASKERQSLEAQNQVLELEPLVSELIQINYAKADDIATILKSVRAVDTGFETSLFGSVSINEVQTESNSLLSARGNVTVDPRTNTILVQDTRSKISEVRKLIAQLDRPVRQVLIETRIVEANDDFSRNIGARLGFTRVTENARFPGVSDSNIGTVIGSASLEDNDLVRTGGSVGDRAGVGVNLGADGVGSQDAASYAFTLAKAGAGFAHLIDLEISALEAEGTGKVIANPRLMTTDQNQARIEQGQERVFTTSVLGEGSVVTKKAVLGLTVTPQITPDNRMVLDVFVTKDTFTAADASTINTKQIRTKVLLDNGETVVIGGIYEQNQAESTTKVPILGDVPVLGALFRKRNRFDNRTELLIFLTPRILDPALTAN